MREAADRRKELEREHSETLVQLRDKQAEVSSYKFNLLHNK
jgi:hypothetical protein